MAARHDNGVGLLRKANGALFIRLVLGLTLDLMDLAVAVYFLRRLEPENALDFEGQSIYLKMLNEMTKLTRTTCFMLLAPVILWLESLTKTQ
jgi:hypothetical protein